MTKELLKFAMATCFCMAISPPTAYAKPLGDPRPLTDGEKKIVIRAVERQLKDPDSAKYRWFQYNGRDQYCGTINSKNSYGGYVGYQHFYVKVTKDNSGMIATAQEPNILGEDAPARQIMVMICETAARPDSEDKTPLFAEP